MTFVALSILLYFLPSIIGRDRSDAGAIFLVNLFAGWTIIGWVAALIWACSAEPTRYPLQYVPVHAAGRFCSSCGALSPYNAHFCSACGRGV